MNYDLLVHVDLPDTGRFTMAIGNIANYIAALPEEKPQVILVANGGAAPLLCGQPEESKKIRELMAHGVHFRVCANALRNAGLTPDNVFPGVEIVPAGVVELVRLQRKGFAYIKP